MIEFQLGTTSVQRHLIQHVERVSGLVETALDVQVSSFISTDIAAEIDKSVCVSMFFTINLLVGISERLLAWCSFGKQITLNLQHSGPLQRLVSQALLLVLVYRGRP